MCFSAAASFTSGAFLVAAGVGTLARVKKKEEYALASIPFVFALQQLLEGFIWRSLPAFQIRATFLSIGFLFFALFWWQFFAPFTALLLEKESIRKKVLMMFLLLGVAAGGVLFYFAFTSLLAPQIVGSSIHYFYDVPYGTLFIAIYGITTIGSMLVSSDRFLNLFGVLLFISAVVSGYYYFVNFVSVWCFFGAILSIILLLRPLFSKR